MDDLDLIRSFRADVPGPDAAATARAERAWRPAPRSRGPRWVPRAAVGIAAAAAVAAAALIIPSARDGRLGAESARAAATLRHAAAEARGLPRALRAGEYWYVRSRTVWTTGVEGRRRAVHGDGHRAPRGVDRGERHAPLDHAAAWPGPVPQRARPRALGGGRPSRPHCGPLGGPDARRLLARRPQVQLPAAARPSARPARALPALPRLPRSPATAATASTTRRS